MNISQRKMVTLATLALGLALIGGTAGAKKEREAQQDAFKREEMIVLNLSQGPKSAKFYILSSLKQTRETEKNIERSLAQVQQADSTFAKARKRPDDRTMNGTVQRLNAALQTAQQLERQLQDANDELKTDTQQTLISK